MAAQVYRMLARAPRALARVGVGAAALVAATAMASLANAAEPQAETKDAGDCPPGAFCEQAPGDEQATQAAAEHAAGDGSADAKQGSAAQAGGGTGQEAKVSQGDDGSVTVVLPPSPSDKPRVVVVKQGAAGSAPDVTAYDGASSQSDAAKSPDEAQAKEEVDPIDARHWGLQLRGTGLILPRFRSDVDGPAMGGAGMAIRYRPIAPLALEAGMDVLMGYDSNGLQRREVPFSLSMLVYMLPHSLVQPYAFVGLNTAYARVDSQTYQWNLAHGTYDTYTYVGGHAGLGLELRLAPVVSLSLDGLAFVRERVDDSARQFPEFYDRTTGETSNTSVGGQIRGGLTFWW